MITAVQDRNRSGARYPGEFRSTKESMKSTCQDCERLKREFNEAHRLFLAIAGEKAPILVQQDSAELSWIERYQAAGERRKAACKALEEHKGTHQD